MGCYCKGKTFADFKFSMDIIYFPSNTKEVIDAIRRAIGRPVVFQIIASGVPCSTCGVNPVTNTALDPFCPVCSGEGYIYEYDYVTVSGHITWGYSDLPNWITGGQYFTGDCTIQVEYTEDLMSRLKNVKYVYVDGKTMRMRKIITRGVPVINRILIDLMQED